MYRALMSGWQLIEISVNLEYNFQNIRMTKKTFSRTNNVKRRKIDRKKMCTCGEER